MISYAYKMWGAMGGYVVGALFAALVVNGVATCTDLSNINTCTVFGLSPEWVKNAIEMIFAGLGAYVAPKNVYPK